MDDQIGIKFVSAGFDETISRLKSFQSTVTQSGDAIRGTASAARQIESSLKLLNSNFTAGARDTQVYRQALVEVKRQFAALSGGSIQKAGAEVLKLNAALQAVQADAARTAFTGLVASLDPMAAAVQRFEASMQVLNTAQRENVVTAGEVTRATAALKSQLDAVLGAPKAQATAAFNQLRASIDPTVAAELKLAQAQRTVDEAIRQGVVTADEGARTMRDLTGATQGTAKANELLQRETQMMARAYNPALAAANVFEQEQRQLNRALELGVLSAASYRTKLAQLQTSYANIGGKAFRASKFVNEFGAVVQLGGIKTNRFGLIAQQTGFQVGDFFVQLQSGTNAFVAFGQQATQLAGLLPGLAGAIVGISIAVGTMLLAGWDRTRREHDETGKTAKALEEKLKSLDQTVQDWMRTKKAAALGVTPDVLTGTEALTAAQDRLAGLKKAFAEETALIEASPRGPGPRGTDGVNDRNALMVQSLARRRGPDLKKATDAVIEAQKRVDDLLRKQSEERQKLFEKEVAAAVQAAVAKQQVNNQAAQDRIAALQREVELNQAVLAHGQDSAQAEAVRREQAMQAVEAYIEQKNLSITIAEKLREGAAKAFDTAAEAREIGRALGDATDKALSLSNALAQVSAAALTRSDRIAVLTAQIAAARAGRSTEAAVAQTETRLLLSRVPGADPDQIAAASAAAGEQAAQLARLQATLSDLLRPPSGSSGGTGVAARVEEARSAVDGFLDSLANAEAEQQKFIQGQDLLNAAMAAGQITRDDFNTWLAALREQYLQTDKATRDFAFQNEIVRDFLAQINDQGVELGDVLADAFTQAEDALVRFAETGKLSFRGLANSILADLTRIAIKSATSSIFRGLGGLAGGLFGSSLAPSSSPIPFARPSANGNAFDARGVIPFAQGGIVNSPTLFPFANGVGLMGEAGPEAILPLRRGAGGKLGVESSGGGSGQTTVRVELSPELTARVIDRARQDAVQIVESGFARFSKNNLPGNVSAVAGDPRRVG